MGRIVVHENPFNLSDVREYDFGGPYIAFLEREFPSGFGLRKHVTTVNARQLKVPDYDYEIQDDDVVTLVIEPADPVTIALGAASFFQLFAATAIGNVIIGAAISAALSFAVNAVFGPKGTKPKVPGVSRDLPAASPTYNFSSPTNVARVGDPIPVAYGRNRLVPDLATQPYVWYESNEQFIGLILCLGHGTFDVHNIYLADTNIDVIGNAGIANYWLFPPSVHNKAFGIIGGASGVFENVYTSPEVSDQELDAIRASDPIVGYTSTATIWNGKWKDYEGGIFYFDYGPAYEYVAKIKEGKRVWAIVSGSIFSNNGVREIGFLAGSEIAAAGGLEPEGNTDPFWYLNLNTNPDDFGKKGHLLEDNAWILPIGVTEERVTISLTDIEPGPEYQGIPVGPFIASPIGSAEGVDNRTTLLAYDIIFPQGCYQTSISESGIFPFTVALEFIAEPINDAGVVIGAGVRRTYSETFVATTPQRRTIYHSVPFGRYRVTGFRTTPKSGLAGAQSTVIWAGLKSVMGNTMGAAEVYGDVTLLAIKVRATNGISNEAISRVSVDCTRRLNGVATRNPITVFKDVFTNTVYGGARPAAELDLTKINALESAWSGRTFDAVFDTRSNLWEALRSSIQMQYAAPVLIGSLVSVVEDVPKTVPEFVLTEDNIVSLSLQVYDNPDDIDGIEGEYRDPTDNAPLYVTYPPSASKPETIVLWGCRDYTSALAYVTRRWKQILYRRLLAKLETEAVGFVIPEGAAVSVQHCLLGADPVLFVVNSVTPKDDLRLTIDLHRYQPEVYV